MPWEAVLANASPYAILVVLLWLLYEQFKFIVKQAGQLTDMERSLETAISTLKDAAKAQEATSRALEVLCSKIAALENSCNKIDVLERGIERLSDKIGSLRAPRG